jgi:N-acetylmuramoyl-L-alanine amidase
MTLHPARVTAVCLLASVLLLAGCGGSSAPGVTRDDPGSPPAAISATPAAEADIIATGETGASVPASAESAAPAMPDSSGNATQAQSQPLPLHPFLPAKGQARVVALDPGHGGPEVGSAGGGVAEKDVNLKIALKLRQLLEQDGFRVLLTREGDYRAASPENPQASGSYPATRLDLQARIDLANAAGADVYISIHNNGSTLPQDAGTEVWWDGGRPFAAYNKALAGEMLSALLGAIRAAGYPAVNRGLKEDSDFRVRNGRSFPIFVLGPPRTGAATTRATKMPAVLGETLFLTNPAEARLLASDAMLTAIARGYHAGLLAYFRLIDEGALALPPGGLPGETPNHYDTPFPGAPADGQMGR